MRDAAVEARDARQRVVVQGPRDGLVLPPVAGASLCARLAAPLHRLVLE